MKKPSFHKHLVSSEGMTGPPKNIPTKQETLGGMTGCQGFLTTGL